jgi:hypothetical protein
MLPTVRNRRYPIFLGSAFPAGVGVPVQGVKEAARLEHQNNMVPRRIRGCGFLNALRLRSATIPKKT